jgi:hypothetical protein
LWCGCSCLATIASGVTMRAYLTKGMIRVTKITKYDDVASHGKVKCNL